MRFASNWMVPRSVLVLLMVTLLMMVNVPVCSTEDVEVTSPPRIAPPGFTTTDLLFPTSGFTKPLPASTAPFPTTTLPGTGRRFARASRRNRSGRAYRRG